MTATDTATWTDGNFAIDCEEHPDCRVSGAIWGVWGVHANSPHGYSATHIPSGREVGEFYGEALAKGYCEEIAPLMDWSAVRTLDDVPVRVITRAKRVRVLWGGR